MIVCNLIYDLLPSVIRPLRVFLKSPEHGALQVLHPEPEAGGGVGGAAGGLRRPVCGVRVYRRRVPCGHHPERDQSSPVGRTGERCCLIRL